MSRSRRRWWLILAALIAGLTSWILIDRRTDDAAPTPSTSLAVMPFETESTDAEPMQLATGLSLDLLRRLQALGSLQLSPRGQVATLRDTEVPSSLVARQLGAEILILGRVVERSGRVTLNLEIVDARDNTPISSLELVEPRERIFDLQRRAAQQVVRALDLRLRPSERSHLRRDPTRSLKAWDYFIRAQRVLEEATNPRGPAFAADLFRRAIQLDPDFANAHIGLSEALWLGHLRQGEPENLVEAELEARWVLSRDPSLGSAAVALTKVLQTTTRTSTNRRPVVPEVRDLLKPDEALRDIATGLLQVGRLELAEAAWRAAVELDGEFWLNPYCLGQFLLHGGRFGEAAVAFVDAAERSGPEMTWPRESLTRLKLASGDLAGAIEVFETFDSPLSDVEMIRQVAVAYAILDRSEPAELLYRQALLLNPVDAWLYQELGDVLTRQDRLEEATEIYTEGLRLVEKELDGSPSDMAIQSRLTLLAAKVKDCTRVLPLAASIGRRQELSAESYYHLALALALCHDSEMAIETLRTALSLGLEPERVRSAPEFKGLETDTRLRALLSEAKGIPPSP